MTPAGILESVLYAGDLGAAEDFYTRVLGFTVHSRLAGRHVFFRCGDGMLLIFNPEATRQPAGALKVPVHGTDGAGHLCFRASAAEISAWHMRLAGLGVGIEADVIWPTGGRSIYFRDPTGNSIEFAEPRIWGLP